MKNSITRIAGAAALFVAALGPAEADWQHSVFVTPSAQEATTWCGVATAQMAMTGYPGGTSCTESQADIAAAIGGHKVEAFWDTDPKGMEKVLEDCGGNWSITAKSTRAEAMYWVARWMGKYNYPVPVVLDTAPATTEHPHDEHWVLVTGVRTDVDPTVYPPPTTVDLLGVWFIDPQVPLSLPSTPGIFFRTGSQWDGLFQAVTKAASAYNGKFVAVIEPPDVSGVALSPAKPILYGKVIPIKKALAAARDAIKHYGLAENPAFSALADGEPLPPILVNREQGGYYLIPYSRDGETADVALLVNAYTGDLLEAGSLGPISYLSEKAATDLALRHLEQDQPGTVSTEAVHLNEAGHAARYRPIWKVRVDDRIVGVSQTASIRSRMSDEIYALPVNARRLAAITGSGGRLWVSDGSSGRILELQPATGGVLRHLAMDLARPKGLVFDGSLLWVADEASMQIVAFDPVAGEKARAIPLEIPKEKGFDSIEALAWDGTHLWTAIAAGFSSSLNQVDPATGRIVRSVFAGCDPRGLASDGERLWTLCYNGDKHPPTVGERTIAAADKDGPSVRRFIKRTEGRHPSGLAFDGEFLWYTDAVSNRAVRFLPPRQQGKEATP